MKTLVVIPTFNERENIRPSVAGILALKNENIFLLIVDDASPDETGKIADALAVEYPKQISVLHRKGKLGLGSAYLEGFRYGIAHGFEIICEMDADGSHDPSALPTLLAGIGNGADVAIGSRRIAGGKIMGWGIHRHIMSAGASIFAQYVLGLKTKDATSGFRCYRNHVVRALLEENIASDGYAFQEETLFHCERLKFNVVELPIVFRDRTMGLSKLSWKEIPPFFIAISNLRSRYGRLENDRPTL